ncbi:hypothetical protein HC030_18650 [Planosporangium mesophilum]|nr:hypothetical protein [Planosporangium mesophilum]
MLRILAACPGARGVGVEIHGPDVARGRTNAAARESSDRVPPGSGPCGSRPPPVANGEEFESGMVADVEEWLLSHGDHPEADELRAKLDAQRNIWLRGHRDVMGFAYLTLGRVS